MSNETPWEDIGGYVPKAKPETNNHPRVGWVAMWVKKGLYNPTFTRADLETAIEHAGLDRKLAASWAAKHLPWLQAYEILNQRPYVQPPADKVRDDWRKIPLSYLTDAERALSSFNQPLQEPQKMPGHPDPRWAK